MSENEQKTDLLRGNIIDKTMEDVLSIGTKKYDKNAR